MSSVDEKNKSAVKADDDTIIYAKKIEKNAAEDKVFSQKIDDFTKGKLKSNEVIRVGTTPYCLRIVGAEPVPLVVPQNVLANSLYSADKLSNQTKKRHSKQHNISQNVLETLPKMIRTPILIGKGSVDGTLVVVTEKKNTYGDPIIVPIMLSVKAGKTNVNKVTTITGKERVKNYLETMITSHKLLAINEEKAVRLYEDTGVQFPQSLTAIRFDNSIAYSMKNVKGFEKNPEADRSQKAVAKQQNDRVPQKKIFTFSRTNLNENSRKIKEDPSENKNRDRSKKHNKER